MMRLLLLPILVMAAATAGCDGENSVHITSSTTSNSDSKGVLKVVQTLQCPESLGSLTRKGSAQNDGSVCVYAGPRGAEVTLTLVKLDKQTADQALRGFETQLLAAMPHTAAQINASAADAARAEADAKKAADDAQAVADGANPNDATVVADDESVSINAPGMKIDTQGDKATVRLPGINIQADGDRANVRIGGLTINADDTGKGGASASASTSTTSSGPRKDAVSIQANDNSAEIRTRAPGDATRQTYLLTDNRASVAGWRLVGYEARGPRGGPIVVATVRAKERNSDGVFSDAKELVTLNIGD